MRTDIIKDSKVPAITCVVVCFLSTTLDHPIRGSTKNIKGSRVKLGKRYIKVVKSKVA